MRRATVKIAGRLGWDIANSYLDWVEDHTPSASALAAQRRWARTDAGPSQVHPGPPFRCRDANESLAYSAHLAASNVSSLVHRGLEG